MPKARKYNKGDLSNKRRKKSSKNFLLVLGIFILIFGGIAFLRIPAFLINKVEIISSEKFINEEKIKEIASSQIAGSFGFVVPKSNFFFYPKEKIKSSISSEFPEIGTIKVGASIDNTLEIEITPRKTFAIWCRAFGDSECYSMDYSGLVFSRVTVSSAEAEGTVIYSGLIEGNPIDKKFGEDFAGLETGELLKNLSSFVKQAKSIGINITRINVLNKIEAIAVFDKGILKFTPAKASDEIFIENLKLFIEEIKKKNNNVLPQFEYIDARYGNKIFYK